MNAVKAKHHLAGSEWVTNGQIRVNGKCVPHLRNSQREVLRVSRMLGGEVDFPVPTIPCLAFRLHDGKLTIKESPANAPKHYMEVPISKAPWTGLLKP